MISNTQLTNYLSLAGALVVILGYFDIKIDVNDLAMLIGASVTVLGTLLNMYHRYSKGGVTVLGIKTEIKETPSDLG